MEPGLQNPIFRLMNSHENNNNNNNDNNNNNNINDFIGSDNPPLQINNINDRIESNPLLNSTMLPNNPFNPNHESNEPYEYYE